MQVQTRGLISDQSSNSGTPGFYLMPPLVPIASAFPASSFDATAAVRVVVELRNADGTSTIAASFSGGQITIVSAIAGNLPLPLARLLETVIAPAYQAAWSPGAAALVGQIYRVHVDVLTNPPRPLGVADVVVVANAAAANTVDRSQFAPLVASATASMNLQFRLARKDSDGDTVTDYADNCPLTANVDQRDSAGEGLGDACQCLNRANGSKCATPCRTGQTCSAGTCGGGTLMPAGASCVSGNPCKQTEICDAVGTCGRGSNRVNGLRCSTGNSCKEAEVCTNGVCGGGTNARAQTVCSTGNPCRTDERCAGNGQCQLGRNKDNGALCVTGNSCLQNQTCSGGVCGGGLPRANGTSCSDGSLCTQTDTCQAGVCTGSNPITCGISTQCQDAGTCDRNLGLCSPVTNKTGSCSDGKSCTQDDTCSAGVCVGTVSCPAGDACHMAGICDASGACTVTPRPDGTACGDNNACNGAESCLAGACKSGLPLVCDDGNACTRDVCDPGTPGGCVYGPPVCDDSNAGTNDFCGAGDTCTHTTVRYAIEDIGLLPGGDYSAATDISRQGVVVGRANASTGGTCREPFRYRQGVGIERLPGAAVGLCGTSAVTTNDDGTVAFGAGTSPPITTWRFTDATGLQNLGGPATFTGAAPVQINNAGQFAAFHWVGAVMKGFRYSEGVGYAMLSTPGGDNIQPSFITDDGTVLGTYFSGNNPRAALWLSTPGGGLVMEDLNDRLADGTWLLQRAKAGNGRVVVGQGIQNGEPRGYLLNLDSNVISSFGETVPHGGGVFPSDINAGGAIVGFYRDTVDHGFFYTPTDGFRPLDDSVPQGSGWSLTYPAAVNERGQIVGRGFLTGNTRAFLLTPTGPCWDRAEGAGCSSGNTCLVGETCHAGACSGGTAPTCDDLNSCTADSCDPAVVGGCKHITVVCDDGDPATNDRCTPTAGCLFSRIRYALQDIGPLSGGDYSAALDINDSGVVVGRSTSTASGCREVFVYRAGVGVQRLPGIPAGVCGTGAVQINEAGTIAFTNQAVSPTVSWRYTTASGFESLRGPVGFAAATLLKMNDAGEMSFLYAASGVVKAFHYTDALGFAQLASPANAQPTEVMSDGTILGGVTSASGDPRAALWTPGGILQELTPLLDPALNWVLEHAPAGNARYIVGRGLLSGQTRGFLLDRQTLVIRAWGETLGRNVSIFPSAINSSDIIVGSYREGSITRGIVYFPDSGTTEKVEDVVASVGGWTLNFPNAINTQGQIVGSGFLGGQQRAFLLNPIRP